MAEYIKKEDLKFLEIPIAPVIQGEQVHYEQGFLKEWLESVPTADVIERSKIDNALADMQSMLDQEVLNDNVISDVGQGIEIAMGLLKENIGE